MDIPSNAGGGFAKLWTNETSPDGEILDEREFRERLLPSSWRIFVLDNGEYSSRRVGAIYFDGYPMFRSPESSASKITPNEYRLIVFLSKNKNRVGGVTIEDLVENCFMRGKNAARELALEESKIDYHERARQYRNKIALLSRKLKRIDTTFRSCGTGRYALVPWVSFSVLERLHRR